ncbi:MAG: rhodanese-related sulfurtransferase [Bacteroidia bacterium]|nr:rhodanese-related sulfurtransferase [Bacteroidia bacterium]
MLLHNRISKKELKEWIKTDEVQRTTLSFYRYVQIQNPQEVRDQLYKQFDAIDCKGRIYVAHEGINAQMSVPTHEFAMFEKQLNELPQFAGVPFKFAVEDSGKSFYKLAVKVRDKIVADGINDPTFDASNTGKYLNAVEFNQALAQQNVIVIDMRNHYESEVGHFKGALAPNADTFREELPMVINALKDKKDHKILMYCTGGIRCEKASAYLKHEGFQDVNHLQGGIIQYAKEIKEQGLESQFLGKNFVFDERLGERITDDVLAQCHQCGASCDNHTNCANDDCHLLFIQCDDCKAKHHNCCSTNCHAISLLPIEEQRVLRKGRVKNGPECLAVYKSRLRPNLKDLIANNPSLIKL